MPERPWDEREFRAWYAYHARRLKLDQNPDNPRHFYDYRSAYMAGVQPDSTGHWPSKFKKPGHPQEVVDGVNVRTADKKAETGLVGLARGVTNRLGLGASAAPAGRFSAEPVTVTGKIGEPLMDDRMLPIWLGDRKTPPTGVYQDPTARAPQMPAADAAVYPQIAGALAQLEERYPYLVRQLASMTLDPEIFHTGTMGRVQRKDLQPGPLRTAPAVRMNPSVESLPDPRMITGVLAHEGVHAVDFGNNRFADTNANMRLTDEEVPSIIERLLMQRLGATPFQDIQEDPEVYNEFVRKQRLLPAPPSWSPSVKR